MVKHSNLMGVCTLSVQLHCTWADDKTSSWEAHHEVFGFWPKLMSASFAQTAWGHDGVESIPASRRTCLYKIVRIEWKLMSAQCIIFCFEWLVWRFTVGSTFDSATCEATQLYVAFSCKLVEIARRTHILHQNNIWYFNNTYIILNRLETFLMLLCQPNAANPPQNDADILVVSRKNFPLSEFSQPSLHSTRSLQARTFITNIGSIVSKTRRLE